MQDCFIGNSSIKIKSSVPEILTNHFSTVFVEPIQQSVSKFKNAIDIAASIIEKNTPDFFELLKLTNREVCLFNSSNQYSFSSMSYHGTAFVNIENKNRSSVFFIDDISHQCVHVLFYALTLKPSDYLKVRRDTLLSNFSGISAESNLTINERNTMFKSQFQINYGIDFTQENNYDLIVNTDDFNTPEETVSYIILNLK